MPITANQVDELDFCSPCYDNLVYEPADGRIWRGKDGGLETLHICFECQSDVAWRGVTCEPARQPADALAAWDGSTLAERNAAIVDLVGEPVMREAGDRR